MTNIIFIKMIARVLSLSAPPAGRPDSPGNSTHYGGGGDYDDDNDDQWNICSRPWNSKFPHFSSPPSSPRKPPRWLPSRPNTGRITHGKFWAQTIWWSSTQDNLIIPNRRPSNGNEIRKQFWSSTTPRVVVVKRRAAKWSIVTNAPNFPARSLLSISEIALAADHPSVTTAGSSLGCDRTTSSTLSFLPQPGSTRSGTETSSSQAANSRWVGTKSAGWGRHMSTTRGRGGKN